MCPNRSTRGFLCGTLLLAFVVAASSEGGLEEKETPLADCHVSLAAYEFYANPLSMDFASTASELRKFYLKGGRSAGIVFAVPDRYGDSNASNLVEAFRTFLTRYQLMLQRDSGIVASMTDVRETTKQLVLYLAVDGLSAELASMLLEWKGDRMVRTVAPLHNSDNEFGASCYCQPDADAGLSSAGVQVVSQLMEHGYIVDVSHCSQKTIDGILALSQITHSPVIASHSAARALNPHCRNLTDSQIRGIAQTGGGIGVFFHVPFIAKSSNKHETHCDDLVDHIRYIAKLVGSEHVFIGSDLCEGIQAPPGMTGLAHVDLLEAKLSAAGLSTWDIDNILWRNIARILNSQRPVQN